ncbi:MAG: hypothetical protein ABIP81_05540 [Terriglobales bacterium]
MKDDRKTNQDPEQCEGLDQTPLDQLLDKSLAQYAQVSPLAGLEERILARLEDEAAQPEPGLGSRVAAKVGSWLGVDPAEPFAGQRLAGALTAVALVAGIALGMFLVTRPGEDTVYVGQNDSIDVAAGTPVEAATAPLPARIPQEAFRASTAKLAQLFGANPVKPMVKFGGSRKVAGAEVAGAEIAGVEIAGAKIGKTEAGLNEARAEVFPAPAPLSEQERLAVAYARHSQRSPATATVAGTLPEPGIRELEVPMLQVTPIKVEELQKPGPAVSTTTNTSK